MKTELDRFREKEVAQILEVAIDMLGRGCRSATVWEALIRAHGNEACVLVQSALAKQRGMLQ